MRENLEVDLGVLKNDVDHVKGLLVESKQDRVSIHTSLDNIEKTLAEARGQYKMLLTFLGLIASLSGVLGGLLTWFMTHRTILTGAATGAVLWFTGGHWHS